MVGPDSLAQILCAKIDVRPPFLAGKAETCLKRYMWRDYSVCTPGSEKPICLLTSQIPLRTTT